MVPPEKRKFGNTGNPRSDRVTCEVTGLVGIYTDPEHVIFYTRNCEARQEFSIVLTFPASRPRAANPLRSAGFPATRSKRCRWTAQCGCESVTSSLGTRLPYIG